MLVLDAQNHEVSKNVHIIQKFNVCQCLFPLHWFTGFQQNYEMSYMNVH